jgi:hypothetical protein
VGFTGGPVSEHGEIGWGLREDPQSLVGEFRRP